MLEWGPFIPDAELLCCKPVAGEVAVHRKPSGLYRESSCCCSYCDRLAFSQVSQVIVAWLRPPSLWAGTLEQSARSSTSPLTATSGKSAAKFKTILQDHILAGYWAAFDVLTAQPPCCTFDAPSTQLWTEHCYSVSTLSHAALILIAKFKI